MLFYIQFPGKKFLLNNRKKANALKISYYENYFFKYYFLNKLKIIK